MFETAKEDPNPRAALGLIACLLGLAISSQAGATLPVRKTAPEPAATLLLPYFEQDLSSANSPTTAFSVNNASPQAVLVAVRMSGAGLFSIGFDAIQLDNAAHPIHP